jgi:hypothetical protein
MTQSTNADSPNPYTPPSLDSAADNDRIPFAAKIALTVVGAAFEIAFALAVVGLFYLGGYWALFATFVGVPALIIGAAMLLLRGWKQKRHAYLREKRANKYPND